MIKITKCIRIQAPVNEIFSFWKNFENFSSFIHSVESVHKLDDDRSRWVVRAPFGMSVKFESEITETKENELIRWRSVHGVTKGIKSDGEIRFHQVDEGQATDVHVKFNYELPIKIAEKITERFKPLGFPSRHFDKGLEEIKERIETSNVV